MNTPEPTQEDIQKAIDVITYYSTSGFLPRDLLHGIAQSSVTATTEIVALIDKPSGLHVVIAQREDDDPAWPAHWHVTGTILRPTDTPGSFMDGLDRIAEHELGGATFITGPHQYTIYFNRSERGPELTVCHWALLEEEPDLPKTQTVPVDKLPEPFLAHQHKLVASAAEAYRQWQKK